jgi:hypothetical protein
VGAGLASFGFFIRTGRFRWLSARV